jgi:hypothetical protein
MSSDLRLASPGLAVAGLRRYLDREAMSAVGAAQRADPES